MKILSIYSKVSSLEFSFFDMKDESLIVKGVFDRVGLEGSNYTFLYNGDKINQEIELNDFNDVVRVLLEKLVDLEIIKSIDEIDGVGHRIVHGRDKYNNSLLITDSFLDSFDELLEYSPAYNKANYDGIVAFKKALPLVPMSAVFDTSFHQTMSEENYLYSIPYKWYKEYGVRKYGFHGIGHRFIAEAMKNALGTENSKIISIYLGNSNSVTAISNMKCVDTSMGFTPLAGVMMNTRSGDIDPSMIPYIMEKEGKNAGEVIDDLNKNSGLIGMSEFSSEVRDICDKCDEGDERALIARSKFVRRIVDYIAQYYVLLGGVDAIAFAGGIGENCIPIRREICERLACLGVKIDLDLNNKHGELFKFSTEDSAISLWVVPTNCELMIARDTVELIKNR